jgi:hypothetical protein
MRSIVPFLGLFFVFSSSIAEVKPNLASRMDEYISAYCSDSPQFLSAFYEQLRFEKQVRQSICAQSEFELSSDQRIMNFYRAKESWENIEKFNRRQDVRRFDRAMKEYYRLAFDLGKEMSLLDKEPTLDQVWRTLNEFKREAKNKNLADRTQIKLAGTLQTPESK